MPDPAVPITLSVVDQISSAFGKLGASMQDVSAAMATLGDSLTVTFGNIHTSGGTGYAGSTTLYNGQSLGVTFEANGHFAMTEHDRQAPVHVDPPLLPVLGRQPRAFALGGIPLID